MRQQVSVVGFIDEIQDGDLTGCGSRMVMAALVSSIDRNRFSPVVFTPHEGLFATTMRNAGAQVRVGRLPAPRRFYRVAGNEARPVISGFAGNLIGGPGLVYAWAREFKAAGLDLVYLSTVFSHLAGSAAARLARIPAVCHVQGELQASHKVKLLATPYLVWCMTMGATSVAISRHVAAGASLTGIFRPQIIFNGIDTDRFKPPAGPIAPGKTVGLVSSISPLKRLHLLPDVAAKVIATCPDAEFIVVGRPSDKAFKDMLDSRLAASGLTNKVVFRGAMNNLQDVYPTFDVLLHLTAVEGFGLVIAEAMSCGCPVVAINRGGPAEVVANGVTGLLVDDPEDTAAIADAVTRLLGNPEEAARMGAAGRVRIEQNFSQKIFVAKFEQLFSQLLGSQVV